MEGKREILQLLKTFPYKEFANYLLTILGNRYFCFRKDFSKCLRFPANPNGYKYINRECLIYLFNPVNNKKVAGFPRFRHFILHLSNEVVQLVSHQHRQTPCDTPPTAGIYPIRYFL